MNKFKAFISRQTGAVKDIFFKYPVTITSSVLASIVGLIGRMRAYNLSFDDILSFDFFGPKDPFAYAISFLILFAVGAFFTETLGQKKQYLYTASAVISAALTVFLNYFYEKDGISPIASAYIERTAVLYIIVCIFSGLFIIIKRGSLGVPGYMVSLFFSFLKIFGIFLLFYFGVVAVLAIFDSLIVHIEIWDISTYIQTILNGFLYVPYILICITYDTENKSKFARGTLLFACVPILLCAFAIIYAYVLKIIFTWSLPSNEVFTICAALFAAGVVVWTMASSFIKDADMENCPKAMRIYYKIITNLKYFYAPFIILEIISMGIRIGGYGFTIARYFAVIYIIAQVIYILWDVTVKKGLEYFLFVGIGIYIITLLVPFTSADYVEYRSLKNRFEKEGIILTENQPGGTNTGSSLYYTLDDNIFGQSFLEKNPEIASQWENMIFETDETNSDKVYMSYHANAGSRAGVNVTGYDMIYPFQWNYDVIGIDEPMVKYWGPTGEFVVTIHPGELARLVMEASARDEENYLMPYPLTSDEGDKVMVTKIWFIYRDTDDVPMLDGLDIEGFLLK